MDTIVILDRIRENVKVLAGQPYDRIVNTSILQTMTRSVNTLLTVVVTLVALLAFGGASLQNFAFALLVGICSGGYHSIFYSAPLVNILRERQLRSTAHRRQLQRDAAMERPRTVAEAREQAARTGLSRDEILAARKERRRKTTVRPVAGPARYRRKRVEPDSSPALQSAETPSAHGDPDAYGDEFEYEVDPLDAQEAGLHDEALALGHEEIRLNLDDDAETEGAPSEPAAVKHD
jgi:hypothetical protein